MLSPELASRLAGTLNRRIADRTRGEMPAAASWLRGLIGSERAEALLGGEPVALSADERGRIAEWTSLDEELLSCLFAGASREVLRHAVSQVQGDLNDSGACAVCVVLGSRCQSAEDLSEEELELLISDLLDHLQRAPLDSQAGIGAPAVEDALDPEEAVLIDTLRDLPDSSRQKVLDVLTQEALRAGSLDDPVADLWRHLDEPARALMSALAHAPGQWLSEGDLCERLGSTPSGLSAIERDILLGWSQLMGEREDAPMEHPLGRGVDGQGIHFGLDRPGATVIRAIVRDGRRRDAL
ncbi:hypothetical protein [Miltoncostaea oceani]|uniref:hypothetical protein n=1 Tax=Miltoncostaea oceani TaxID=2843216 RepID=UPI001C3C6573|nr:hypothetical protein [Miltoncostaea oceani]